MRLIPPGKTRITIRLDTKVLDYSIELRCKWSRSTFNSQSAPIDYGTATDHLDVEPDSKPSAKMTESTGGQGAPSVETTSSLVVLT